MAVTRFARLIVAGLLLAVLSALPAKAERRVALVIGNSDYTSVPALPNPANDARLMAATLEELGFEVTTLIDADEGAMKQAMLEFGRTLRSGPDASLFYYAGHGIQAHGENYLIPVDAAIANDGELDLRTVSLDALLRVIESSPSLVNIVVLDACRNNPFPARERSASRGLALVDAPAGTYIAFSTAPGAVAVDGDGDNSPFAAALSAAMTTPGLKIEDTFKEARRMVIEATGRAQVPWDSSSITGDFYFVPAEAVAAAPAEPVAGARPVADAAGPVRGTPDQETTFWTSIADSTDPADFEAYLQQFPDGVFAPLARNRLAALGQQEATPGAADNAGAADAAAAGASGLPGEGAESAPAVVAALTPEEPDPVELARSLQSELQQRNCYAGTIDGIWGPRSRRALESFDRAAGLRLRSLEPDADLLAAVAAVAGVSCRAQVSEPPRRVSNEPRTSRTAPVRRQAPSAGRCVKNNVPPTNRFAPPFVIWGTNTPCTP